MSLIKKISGELVKGGVILLISMNIFNFLNYIFHFVSARMLGPVDYGILATLMSIVYIFNIPSEAIQTISSRYSTKFNIENRNDKIKNLMIRLLKKFFMFGILGFLIFIAISPILGKFLSIGFWLLALTGIVLISLSLASVSRGILQGTKKFNSLGLSYILESSIKIAFTIFLISVGFGVYGAMGSVVFGVSSAFAFTFIPLRKILRGERKEERISGIYSYSFPVLASVTSITLLYSIDIILARIFFQPEIVGNYAVISILSKIIFFGTSPISKAMFPIASEKYDKKEGSSSVFKKSIFVVLLGAIFVLLLYYLIPKSIIRILYGAQYISMAPMLIYPAIAMGILSLTNVFVLYNLCINRYKKNYFLIFFAFSQVTLLFLFHSSLLQFVSMLILNNILLFITVFILSFKK